MKTSALITKRGHMIIDFHIHIFPDEIAEKAIKTLSERSGLTPQTNGTAKNTIEKMNEWSIDKAVCLNIATKPSQTRKINLFMENNTCSRFIPFGTVYPIAENALEEIEHIKSVGIKGIKLHPDYQNFYADDENIYPIYSLMEELELPLLFHSGYDIGLGCPIHCTPLMIKKIADSFPKLQIIAAHFGGYGLWKDASELLYNKENVYFDTAFPVGLDESLAEKIICKKGADHILFASDCPWDSPKRILQFIDSLKISDSDKEFIYGKNAQRLIMNL